MPLTFDPAFVLDRTLRSAGIPIAGVSVGDPAVRSTWRAEYLPTATDPQKTQGDQLVATLDLAAATTLDPLRQDVATVRSNDDLLQAMVQALYEAIPAPAVTIAQLKARILQLYRAKL